MMIIYVTFFAIFGEKDSDVSGVQKDPMNALVLAAIGCVLGWLALEVMVIGLRMSKSALASYAEQVGVVVPFCFDAIALGRPFLKTDWIAVCLIMTLEVVMAMRSHRKKGEEIGKQTKNDNIDIQGSSLNNEDQDQTDKEGGTSTSTNSQNGEYFTR